MPTTVATFYQFQDSTPVGLGAVPMTLTQSVTVTPTGGEAALVTWMAQRTSPVAVTYTVSLNSVLLNTYAVTTVGPTTEIYAMQVSFTTPAVIQGDNVLTFARTGATGTMVISDVLLWVPVNVA